MAGNRIRCRTTRRVLGRGNYNRTLEKTAVDPERQLEISRERRSKYLYQQKYSIQIIEDLLPERSSISFPDMILSVNDFHNHVEVAIQTHGYDTWQGGESNLLITMALTGRKNDSRRRTIINVRRSNNRRTQQTSSEAMVNIGEGSSGKWDYYVQL
ncbi:hypothetical protein Tco_0366855 [Tanacetum coccineum]